MSQIKAFLFDMDGVILDSERICDRTWNIAGKEYNLKDPHVVIQRCRGMNKTDSMLILKEAYGQDFDSASYLARTSELFHQIAEKEGVPLMKGAVEAIVYLKTKYRVALASSTREVTVRKQLSKAGILDNFETITTGDMVTHSKPNPEIYLKSCKSLGLKPEECVAIEDSPNGVKSAYAAGIPVIMIPDLIQPTEEIKSMCWKIYNDLLEMKNDF